MTDTANLGLPFIDGGQAQKHVTHNEALRILDAAIQIAVQDTTRTVPPPGPADGERHVVAAGASGAWAGQATAIATWQDNAWAFLAPKRGWCLWSIADDAMRVFDGTAWRDLRNLAVDNVAHLGINTTADAANRLSVTSNAALLTAIAAADGGSGDIRLQLSREHAAATASVLFSDGYSGRAEFGLVGSDAFKLKISPDGAAWTEALAIDAATGNLALPRGLSLGGVIAPAVITADQNDYAPAGLGAAAMLQIASDAARTISGLAGGSEGRLMVLFNGGSAPLSLLDEDAASLAAHRFALGGARTLGPHRAATLRYDGTAARWHWLAGDGGSCGPGVLAAAATEVVIAIPAAGEAFELTGRIIPAADTDVLWVASYDGGVTYKLGGADYYNYGIRNLGGSIGSVSENTYGGFVVGSPSATYGHVVPSQFRGTLLPGSTTDATAMDVVFAGSNSSGNPFDSGHIQTRVNGVHGRITHLKIIASVEKAIEAETYFSLEAD